MIEEKITLDFWSPCYFSNAGSSNYSSSSTFHLFCLLNFTNNYVFRPLNLLLNCRLHPHCFSFLESKEGTVRWTTPYPLVSMRETPSCSRTSLLCTVLLLAASILVNSMTQTTVTSRFVCMGCESRGMFHKSYPSIKAAKIHVNRHSPMCKAAGLGYRELRVESRRSDAMAGRSPWQADVRHEPHPVSGISHLFAVKTN